MKEILLSLHEFMKGLAYRTIELFIIIFILGVFIVLVLLPIFAFVPVFSIMWGQSIASTWYFIPLAVFAGYLLFPWMKISRNIMDLYDIFEIK